MGPMPKAVIITLIVKGDDIIDIQDFMDTIKSCAEENGHVEIIEASIAK